MSRNVMVKVGVVGAVLVSLVLSATTLVMVWDDGPKRPGDSAKVIGKVARSDVPNPVHGGETGLKKAVSDDIRRLRAEIRGLTGVQSGDGEFGLEDGAPVDEVAKLDALIRDLKMQVALLEMRKIMLEATAQDDGGEDEDVGSEIRADLVSSGI